MEKPTKDPLDDRLGRGKNAPWPNPGQGPHQDCGAVRRRAVQPGDSRFPRYNRRREPPVAEGAGATASKALEWDSREREERLAALREEEERLGWGNRWTFFYSFFYSLFIFPSLPYFRISFVSSLHRIRLEDTGRKVKIMYTSQS